MLVHLMWATTMIIKKSGSLVSQQLVYIFSCQRWVTHTDPVNNNHHNYLFLKRQLIYHACIRISRQSLTLILTNSNRHWFHRIPKMQTQPCCYRDLMTTTWDVQNSANINKPTEIMIMMGEFDKCGDGNKSCFKNGFGDDYTGELVCAFICFCSAIYWR